MYFEEFLNVDASQVLLPGLPNVLVGRGVKLISSEIVGNLDIGDFTCVNRSHLEQGCGIGVSSYIGDTSIGHFAMIGSRVSIGGFEHPTSWLSMAAFQWGQSVNHWNVSVNAKQALQKVRKPSYKRTRIGPDSWIGNNAVVLSGVSVGTGSVVGAASVVTKDVPPYGIVVGNPAKLIRFRFDTRTIARLLATQWWLLPFEFISTLPFDDIKKCLELIESSR
jgi:acetyltransferase-like isoleucine patch superfamily enzyme